MQSIITFQYTGSMDNLIVLHFTFSFHQFRAAMLCIRGSTDWFSDFNSLRENEPTIYNEENKVPASTIFDLVTFI